MTCRRVSRTRAKIIRSLATCGAIRMAPPWTSTGARHHGLELDISFIGCAPCQNLEMRRRGAVS